MGRRVCRKPLQHFCWRAVGIASTKKHSSHKVIDFRVIERLKVRWWCRWILSEKIINLKLLHLFLLWLWPLYWYSANIAATTVLLSFRPVPPVDVLVSGCSTCAFGKTGTDGHLSGLCATGLNGISKFLSRTSRNPTSQASTDVRFQSSDEIVRSEGTAAEGGIPDRQRFVASSRQNHPPLLRSPAFSPVT